MDWVREQVGIEPGPAFGGINLRMFSPFGIRKSSGGNTRAASTNAPWHILYSGDGRERKGTDTVKTALSLIKTKCPLPHTSDWYYGKHINQEHLVSFLRSGDLFLDGHRRAGWCNPVIEAMACGNAVACTDIGATRDFAIDGKTALVVPVDDADAMANAAVRLMADEALRLRLVQNGLAKVKEFDYEVVVPKLEAYLERRLDDG
jgi:glycosyltransferase involved in cell wall biosynthesis